MVSNGSAAAQRISGSTDHWIIGSTDQKLEVGALKLFLLCFIFLEIFF